MSAGCRRWLCESNLNKNVFNVGSCTLPVLSGAFSFSPAIFHRPQRRASHERTPGKEEDCNDSAGEFAGTAGPTVPSLATSRKRDVKLNVKQSKRLDKPGKRCLYASYLFPRGSGGGMVFDSFSARLRRTFANVRERSQRVRGGVYWALQFSVSRACRLARAYGRFAWQAWGIVAAYARCRRWDCDQRVSLNTAGNSHCKRIQ